MTGPQDAREVLVGRLAEAACECGHPPRRHGAAGCLIDVFGCPCRLTEAEALAPTVAALMTEHAARVAGEVVGRVEALVDDWEFAPGALIRADAAAHSLRAALRAGGEGA